MASAGGSASGRRIVKVLPWPLPALARLMLPPCSSEPAPAAQLGEILAGVGAPAGLFGLELAAGRHAPDDRAARFHQRPVARFIDLQGGAGGIG
jgi:hypothetical protein